MLCPYCYLKLMSNQKTIQKEISFTGKALQTGEEVKVVCRPQDPDTGITFSRIDLEDSPVIRLNGSNLSLDYDRRSTVGVGPSGIQTVEHFLAALWGLGVDNIAVDIEGAELPALDGSAKGFLEELEKAGIVEQDKSRSVIKIEETENIEEDGKKISVSPSDHFSISYLIDYDIPIIGQETFEIKLDKASFKKEIAPARTFCLKQEAEALLKAGYGKGANYENTLVLDEQGPIETTLRFKNEPVRHKVLDLIGDLYMLGKPVIGKFVAERSGHKLNAKMVQTIYEKYVK